MKILWFIPTDSSGRYFASRVGATTLPYHRSRFTPERLPA